MQVCEAAVIKPTFANGVLCIAVCFCDVSFLLSSDQGSISQGAYPRQQRAGCMQTPQIATFCQMNTCFA